MYSKPKLRCKIASIIFVCLSFSSMNITAHLRDNVANMLPNFSTKKGSVFLELLPFIFAKGILSAKSNLDLLLLHDKAVVDPKEAAGVYKICACADLCQILDHTSSGLASAFMGIVEAHNIDGFGNAAHFYKISYENAYQHDIFWLIFDFISFAYHIANNHIANNRKFNKLSEQNKQKLNEDKKEESTQTRSQKLKIKMFCICFLSLIETGCSALNAGSLLNENISDTFLKSSALRAKLKAIQSMARLISEMLTCERNSKKICFYLGILIIVVAKLCWDWWNMPFEDELTKRQWQRLYKPSNNVNNQHEEELKKLGLKIFNASSIKEAHKNYLQLAKKNHPDKGGVKERFQLLNEVNSCLQNLSGKDNRGNGPNDVD